MSEDVWLSRYRGGWQLLTPNAGNGCLVGASCHGYHGAASNEPWTLVDATKDSALIEWRGHGLKVQRAARLIGADVVLETIWHAEGESVPFLAVEHVALGPELLDPDFELSLPAGQTYELSEVDGPVTPPESAPVWPRALLLDGSSEQADRWSFDTDRSRFLAVAGLSAGWAEVRNPMAGLGFRIEWDAATLPNAWIWHEVRRTEGRWQGAGQQLMIEPASLPHSLGLEVAVRSGDALHLGPGAEVTSRARATVLFYPKLKDRPS